MPTTGWWGIIVNIYSISTYCNIFSNFRSDYWKAHWAYVKVSKLGWLITWSTQWVYTDSLSFLSSLLIILALSHWNLYFSTHECSAIFNFWSSPFVVFCWCLCIPTPSSRSSHLFYLICDLGLFVHYWDVNFAKFLKPFQSRCLPN